jgi:hypothetical protein
LEAKVQGERLGEVLRWSFVSERQHPSVGDIQVISVSRKIMLADIFASPRPAASFIPFSGFLTREHLSNYSSGPEGRLESRQRCLIR